MSSFIPRRVRARQTEMSLALSLMLFSGAVVAVLAAVVFPSENAAHWFRVSLVSTVALVAGVATLVAGKQLSKRNAGVIAVLFIAVLLILTVLSETVIRGLAHGLLIVVLIVFCAWFLPLWFARAVSYSSLVVFSAILCVRFPSSDVHLFTSVMCLLTFMLTEVFVHFKQNLQDTSLTDPLCTVWNKAGLEVMLQREIRMSERMNSQLSMLYLDLDDFKKINGKRGHLAGDQVLQNTADALQRNLRPTDTVARVGADEFVLVLPNTGAKAADKLASRLRLVVQTWKWTYGVAEYSRGESAAEFIKRSDREMLAQKRAKAAGVPQPPNAE